MSRALIFCFLESFKPERQSCIDKIDFLHNHIINGYLPLTEETLPLIISYTKILHLLLNLVIYNIYFLISLQEFLEETDHAHLAILPNHWRPPLNHGYVVRPTVVLLPNYTGKSD